MNNKPLHPVLRLVLSGALSVVVLCAVTSTPREVPVLIRGDSWQKTLAGALLFVPCFGLVTAVLGIMNFL